jgi:phosphoribosylglycinamide formyltransferase-1
MFDPARVAILISGRGSNMRALVEQAACYQVVLVASNRPEAAGLAFARAAGIATWALDSKTVSRRDYEAALDAELRQSDVGTIALAGFMRLLSRQFVEEWAGRIVNIHPSLLPKYPGLDTHARALAAGDAVSGCSVHLVTEEVDAGEVIAQAEVPIAPGDDAASLERRILAAEHRLYPKALADFVLARSQSQD